MTTSHTPNLRRFYTPASTQPEDIAAVNAQWLAEGLATRTRCDAGAGCGVATLAQVGGKTGLEAMQAMLRGDAPYPSIAKTLDYMLISVQAGEAVFQGVPQAMHLNPMGGVHGGWYATLLDSALGCCIHTLMPMGRGYTTAELSVNIVRAARLDGQPLRAIGRALHCGRQLATAEAQIVGADGTLYAHATTTCLVFELKG